MRILWVTDVVDRPERALCRAMSRQGVDLEIICHPRTPEQDTLVEAGATVTAMDIRKRLDLRVARFIRSRLESKPFDIIYGVVKKALAASLIGSRGKRVKIATYRGVVGHVNWWNPDTQFTFRHRRVSRIVCVCEAIREYLLTKGVPPSEAVTIYKGHDPSWYSPAPREVLREFGIPPDAFVIICTAAMRARKGIPVLIDSLRYLPKDSVHILLVGRITDRRVLPLIAKRNLGHVVHAVGFRPDGPAISGTGDVFVLPSLKREGLAKAVIEAMSQSVPPVVTTAGGSPELVVDGESGFVVPPNDARSLARAFDSLRTDPALRSRLGQGARRRIETAFNVEDYIRNMTDMFRGMLDE